MSWSSSLHADTPRFDEKSMDALEALAPEEPASAPLFVTRLWALDDRQVPVPGTILVRRAACKKAANVPKVVFMPELLGVTIDGLPHAVVYERAKVFRGGEQPTQALVASNQRADAFMYNGVEYRPVEWAHVWLSMVANAISEMLEFDVTYTMWRVGTPLTIPCMPARSLTEPRAALTQERICAAIDYLEKPRTDWYAQLAIRCPPIELALAAAFMMRAEKREWRVLVNI
jgi:hypothetical protein